MDGQVNFYALALILSALVSGVIGIYALHHRMAPGALPLMLVMGGATVWSLGYALELGSSTLEARIWWAQVQYLGITTIPLTMLVLALEYAGQEKWLTRRNLILGAILPIITLVLVWTNKAHGLIWADTRLVSVGSMTWLVLKHGLFFWIYISYSYLVLMLGALALLRTILHTSGLQRSQAALVLVGMLFPWLGNLLYIVQLNPFPNLDLTPIGYSLTGLVGAWGLFRYHLLDIVPVARDKLVDNMRDGVIVLDAQARVVDLNPAAQKWLGNPSIELIGRPAQQVLAHYPDLVACGYNTQETQLQIIRSQGETVYYYDALSSPLLERHGRITGWLITLHDVTERKQVELQKAAAMEALRQAKEAAEASNRAKSAFLDNISHDLRTPLNSILGFTRLMARDPNLTAEQSENLEIVSRDGTRLLALINRVLELTKTEAGGKGVQPEDFDLHHLLEEIEVTATAESLPAPNLALTGMPAEWLTALHQATVEGDMERMTALAEQIHDTYPALSTELLDWIRGFKHKQILQLIEQV